MDKIYPTLSVYPSNSKLLSQPHDVKANASLVSLSCLDTDAKAARHKMRVTFRALEDNLVTRKRLLLDLYYTTYFSEGVTLLPMACLKTGQFSKGILSKMVHSGPSQK